MSPNLSACLKDTEHQLSEAELSPLMAMQAKMNVQGFLTEILFYQLFKDQKATATEAEKFFDQLRQVPSLAPGDPMIDREEALPFIALMDEHMRQVRDRVGSWLKADEGQEPLNGKSSTHNPKQEGEVINDEDPLDDPSFEDVQNFVADELEDLIDSPTLKDKIKGILSHDE